MLIVSLVLSVLMTAWWLWFFVRRDRHPEPAWLLARTFGWGMFAWLVAAAFEASLGRVLDSPLPLSLLAVALLTALIEEGSKFLAASTAVTEASFDEPMDGLVYAVTAALGFALVENLTYALGFGNSIGTWHALVTTLAHALFSAPQGYALGGKFWVGGRWWRSRGLSLSVLLHFVFNSLLTSGSNLWQLAALATVVLLMVVLAGRFYLQYEETARQIEHGATRAGGQRVPDSPRR